jgi:hypothetical protein
MKERSARFDKREGAVFIAKAQEKTPVFRTEKRRNPETGHTYPSIVRSSVSQPGLRGGRSARMIERIPKTHRYASPISVSTPPCSLSGLTPVCIFPGLPGCSQTHRRPCDARRAA